MNIPSAAQIAAARKKLGITSATAASIVHLGNYRRWSEYERGVRRIDLARWELFLIKTGLHSEAQVINGMIVIPMEVA